MVNMKNKKLYFLGLGISNLAVIEKLSPKNEIFFYDDKIDKHDALTFVHYDKIDFQVKLIILLLHHQFL